MTVAKPAWVTLILIAAADGLDFLMHARIAMMQAVGKSDRLKR